MSRGRTRSSEEVKDFFAIVAGERMLAAYVLLATRGMRRGEVLGLRWPDLDLDAGELAVVHTITTSRKMTLDRGIRAV